MKDQLFKIKPDINIVNELLSYFGISNFDDNHLFTKNDLENIKTVEKINDIKDKLKIYYIPCKAKTNLENITEKKCITILRQFLKYFNYTISSKEKYINGKKHNCHYINKKNINKNNTPKKRKIVIDFNI